MTDTTSQENLIGKPLGILSLAAYQPGSVVSREILRKDAGTLTIFAFDEGQGLSEHTAPFDAFVQILEGEAVITIAGNSNRLAAGEFIIMPASQPHSLKAPKKFKMLLVMLKSK